MHSGIEPTTFVAVETVPVDLTFQAYDSILSQEISHLLKAVEALFGPSLSLNRQSWEERSWQRRTSRLDVENYVVEVCLGSYWGSWAFI